MIKRIINIRLGIRLLVVMCGIAVISAVTPRASLLALDTDLWNLPKPPNSGIVWENESVQINGIDASGTHLRAQSEMGEALNFYRDVFLKSGWQIKDEFKEQNIIAFIKGNRFMYVAGQPNGQDAPCDIYVISSPSDLAICKILASYMDKDKGVALQQDAGGRDIPDIPRYPVSKRMVSIFTPSEGAILIYQAEALPAEVANFYQTQLKANGWQLSQAFLSPALLQTKSLGMQNVRVLLFYRDNETLFVSVNLIPKEAVVKETSIITIVKNMMDEFAYPSE